MILLQLFIFSILCYSISNHIVYTDGPFDLYKGLRWFGDRLHPSIGYLLGCMICLPTWVGMILSGIDLWVLPFSLTPMNILSTGYELTFLTKIFIIVFDGFIGSGITWLIHTFQEYMENNSSKWEDSDDVIKGNNILHD